MGAYKIICVQCKRRYRFQNSFDYDEMSYPRTAARQDGWHVGVQIYCPTCKDTT